MGGTPPPFPGHHVLTPGWSSHSPSGQDSGGNLVRSCGGTCPAPCGPHLGCEHSGFQAAVRLQCESTQLPGHAWLPALAQQRCAFKSRWLFFPSAPIFSLVRVFSPPPPQKNKAAAMSVPGGTQLNSWTKLPLV